MVQSSLLCSSGGRIPKTQPSSSALLAYGVSNCHFTFFHLFRWFARAAKLSNTKSFSTFKFDRGFAHMTNRYVIVSGISIRTGVGDAVWQTQINGLYGLLFRRNKEAAFSNYRLWESAGFVIAYAYSTTLCARMKLYLLLGNLVLGVIGYIVVEVRHRRKVNVSRRCSCSYSNKINRNSPFLSSHAGTPPQKTRGKGKCSPRSRSGQATRNRRDRRRKRRLGRRH